jgi:uncharacterized protein
LAILTDAPLVDGHCHPVTTDPVDEAAFELWCTEAALAPRPGESHLDSQVGQAIRRWCGPVLGVPALAPVSEYLNARRSAGSREATRLMLQGADLAGLLVDTGLPHAALTTVDELARTAGAPALEVARLETLAERIAAGTTAVGFAGAFEAALQASLDGGAVAWKSIVAYRNGLAVPAQRPLPDDVVAAAGRWLREVERGAARLTEPDLLHFLIWSAVDTGMPIQIHTGFGDADASIVASDPALLQRFCAATQGSGTSLVLLHCYPYHRQAGWLAHLYPHVYVDIGLTMSYVGARAPAVLGEFLELAPFGKVLYSSDAYGLPELYLVGAAQFRHAIRSVLTVAVTDGAMNESDAQRVADAIGAGNARRVYGLGDQATGSPDSASDAARS